MLKILKIIQKITNKFSKNNSNKSKHYNEQISLLQQKINDLEQENHSLTDPPKKPALEKQSFYEIKFKTLNKLNVEN